MKNKTQKRIEAIKRFNKNIRDYEDDIIPLHCKRFTSLGAKLRMAKIRRDRTLNKLQPFERERLQGWGQ